MIKCYKYVHSDGALLFGFLKFIIIMDYCFLDNGGFTVFLSEM